MFKTILKWYIIAGKSPWANIGWWIECDSENECGFDMKDQVT